MSYRGSQKNDPVTVAIVGLLLVGIVIMGWQQVQDGKLLPDGAEAPDFKVATLTGGELTLSGLRGKVVVLDFWATWCGPCRAEMPDLVAAVKATESQGVTLVAVSMDDVDDQADAVGSFVKAFPELEPYAAFGRSAQAQAYLVSSFPTVYVLDRHGHIVASQAGQASRAQLDGWIARALAEP